MNILDEANKIVNERSEEKERAYGSFSEGMKRAASIASGMTGKDISADDMFACMVALKFSRQSFNHKTDNLLDAVAYIGAWNNFIDEKTSSKKDGEYEKLAKKIDDIISSVKMSNDFTEHLSEHLLVPMEDEPEDTKHLSPMQDPNKESGQSEFKHKFEEEVFGEKKNPGNWAQMSPAQAFRELEEKLQIITDSIIAVHNNMMDVKREVNMNTEYAKYLAENIDKSISYQEYLAEQLDKNIAKVEANEKHMDVLTKYAEYIAEKVKPFVEAGDAGPR